VPPAFLGYGQSTAGPDPLVRAFQVSEKAGKDVLELFSDLEEYIGEAIYSLAKQGTDQSMAETIRQFIMTQVQTPPTSGEVTVLTGDPQTIRVPCHCSSKPLVVSHRRIARHFEQEP